MLRRSSRRATERADTGVRAARVRLIGGIGLVLAAVGAGLVLARTTAATAPVLVASRVLHAGEVLRPEDVKAVHARLAGEQAALLLEPADLDEMMGMTLGREVQAGALLERSSLVRARGDTRLLSFAVARSDAVGGRVGAGDTIDVVATTGTGVDACTRVVADGLQVVEAGAASGRAGAPTGEDGVEVTVDAPAADVIALSHAVATGRVVLVLATGAPPAGEDVSGACDDLGGGR